MTVTSPSGKQPQSSHHGRQTDPAPPPRKSAEQIELEKLRRQNQKLTSDLTKTRMALDIMGKKHTRSCRNSPRANRTTDRPGSPDDHVRRSACSGRLGAEILCPDRTIAGDALPTPHPERPGARPVAGAEVAAAGLGRR